MKFLTKATFFRYLLCPGCRAQYLRKTPAGHRQVKSSNVKSILTIVLYFCFVQLFCFYLLGISFTVLLCLFYLFLGFLIERLLLTMLILIFRSFLLSTKLLE